MEATESPTPSAPTATPSAAPATSAPSPSPAPSERPSFAEAFATDAAAEPSTPSDSTASAAIAQTESVTPDGVTPDPGPMPFQAHKTALENARIKERERVTQEFEQQYGWAKTADRAAIESAQQIGQMYANDRPGFIRQVMAEALADPNMAPLVRSEAARVLGQRAQAPTTPAVDLSPDIPVMDESGQVVAQTYSHERLQQVVAKAIEDFAARELSPIKRDYQTRQQQAETQRMQQELQTATQDIYAEALDVLPNFKEHEQEIAAVFATLPATMAPDKALRAAWKQVVGGKLAHADQVRATQLTELKTKAAASSVNPASAAMPVTKRPTSFNDPSLKW